MNIRKATKKDFEQMKELYKEAFSVHLIFTKEDSVIMDYLNNFDGEFIVAVEGSRIIGALGISAKNYDGHKLIRLKHIAVAEEYHRKGIGSELIKEAEKIAGKGKIEIHVAESEKTAINFYEKNGYEVEGRLKSHYRKGETCYILGKAI